jgi:hypothetical protein
MVGSPREPRLSGARGLRSRDGCCLLLVFQGTRRRRRRRYFRTRRSDEQCRRLPGQRSAVFWRDRGRRVWRLVRGATVRGQYVEVSHRNGRRKSLRLRRLEADVLPRHGRRRMRIRDRHADVRRGPVELPGRDGVLLDCTSVLPNDGGGGRRRRRRCRRLSGQGSGLCERDGGRRVYRLVRGGGLVRGKYVEMSHWNGRHESLWLLRLAADVLPRHGRRRMHVRDRLVNLRWWCLELPGRHGVHQRLCLRALRRRGSCRRRRLSLNLFQPFAQEAADWSGKADQQRPHAQPNQAHAETGGPRRVGREKADVFAHR